VARVVVSGVVVGLGSSELLGSRSLRLGVQILDLGLTENAAKLSVNYSAQSRELIFTCRCCWMGTCRPLAG
jgi:hypothetical protein